MIISSIWCHRCRSGGYTRHSHFAYVSKRQPHEVPMTGRARGGGGVVDVFTPSCRSKSQWCFKMIRFQYCQLFNRA